jgi:hypothetical protein
MYMRDAAYMVAVQRVVEAMRLRGWIDSETRTFAKSGSSDEELKRLKCKVSDLARDASGVLKEIEALSIDSEIHKRVSLLKDCLDRVARECGA